jgi:hypothetical protein
MNQSFISRVSPVLALGLLLAGCTAFQEGKTVVKYDTGQEPRMTEVDTSGTYALYSSQDATPQTTVPLEKGERIGFRREDGSGKLVAVAGSKEPTPINESHNHYWRRR